MIALTTGLVNDLDATTNPSLDAEVSATRHESRLSYPYDASQNIHGDDPQASRTSLQTLRDDHQPTLTDRRKSGISRHEPSPTANARHDSNDFPEPSTGATSKYPSGSLNPSSLLPDTSSYTNPHLSMRQEHTTLEELAHLVRLSKYQERKRANTRIRLQRSLISTALSARLTRCGEVAHRNLVEHFRKDEKDSFTSLYNAIHDVRKSCDELRRFALLEPDMRSFSSPALGSSESLESHVDSGAHRMASKPSVPFLNEISASSRDTFLSLLNQIRTNPAYLAARFSSLTSSELNSLLSAHKGLEHVESVLPSQGRSPARSHNAGSAKAQSNADVERLLSFQRQDALSILVHTCFANSAGPDSSEDKRRIDVWATACARLISEPKSSGENFLISIMNIWTAMRDWSGKSNMEWYLMKILEDGAFLLDRAEDQHGTRFNLSDWNHQDEVAAKRFYDKAVHDLFGLIDNEDGTGIPEGLLEIGNAVIRKLSGKYVENTSRWLVWRCLFFVFLLGVIIHPESYGMLADYHITPYAREKILKKVAMKAHEYVSSMWSGRPSATCVPVEVPPIIKGHIEGILTKFQGSGYIATGAKLLPARSITSLRETLEVHPYLVVSPADLVTLVNALFPERRPQSAASSSFRSGPASISGFSTISQSWFSAQPRVSDVETASIISTTASSTTSESNPPSDGHSADPNLATPQRYSPSIMGTDFDPRASRYEDDGYRLRLAVHELKQTLGTDSIRGVCHPCAERWMVLFISTDGRSLSTQMTFDPEDEVEHDDSSSNTSSDDEDAIAGPDLGKEYHQLRDSVLKLVEDFEIPQSYQPEGFSTQFSNRTSRLRKYRSKTTIISPGKITASRNPYRSPVLSHTSEDSSDQFSPRNTTDQPNSSTISDQPEATLVTMLRAASSQSTAQADFVSSHIYWKTLHQLNALTSPSLRQDGFAALIDIFSRGPRDSIRTSAAAAEEYDAWLVWLKQSQERHEGSIDRMMKRVRTMRDKMWYVTDVRNSKEYTHSRDICQALKTMGMPRRWNSYRRSRASMARGPNASYLFRAESQIIDLLAASEEQGGPNKLSDDQAEMTTVWLKKNGIENFCQGEERIHRFCCEVDKCVSKLIGETIREAPVLWSSELYKRDKVVYDRLKAREKEHSASIDDAVSVMSDNDRDRDRRYPIPTSRGYSFARDLRTISAHNGSQFSIDSARHSIPRVSGPLSDVWDGNEYFDRVPMVHNAESSHTFWSPFQPTASPDSASRPYSPTTSVTNLSTTFSGPTRHSQIPSASSVSVGRPATYASSNETIYQGKAMTEKTRFLDDLRQTLTSLLLSDLGVLAKGSETDAWFQDLGQQCIDRKDALEQRARRRSEMREKERSSRSSTRPRVIEKKKSFGNLRGAGESLSDRASEPRDDASTPNRGSPSLRETAIGDVQKSRSEDQGFPFKKAYQKLLNMFCVHPNPYAKLNALHELENLIVASLQSQGSKRSKWNRSDAGSSVAADQGPKPRSTPLEGTIDNVKQRRSEALQSSLHRTDFVLRTPDFNLDSRSIGSGGAVSTDAITSELQRLFRDASIRPKSLFRDLQLIASFVPSSVLDKPDRGKAFWNAGLAALKLKSEVCRTMMEMADEVIAAHTQARSSLNEAIKVTETPQYGTSGTPPPPSTTYRLEDGGRMWVITAKEGFPTAQRELGLFYLSRPEYVERTTRPLSKPREVFKQVVMDKYGRNEKGRTSGSGQSSGAAGVLGSASRVGGGAAASGEGWAGGGGKEGDVRNDPGLMCVAVHWMEAAEHGGDELATSFLRQNEFKVPG